MRKNRRFLFNSKELAFEENKHLLMELNVDETSDKNQMINTKSSDNNSHQTENSNSNHNNNNHNSEHEFSNKTYTVEDAVEHSGLGVFQIIMIFQIGVLSAADAMEMLLLSILGPELQCEWQLTPSAKALITTIVFIGFLLGSFFWGIVSDNYGRKATFLVVMGIISYAGVLTSFSPNYIWLIIFRGIVGFGIGGASSSFTLLSEFLPSKSRGKVLILNQFWWAFGSTFEVGLAYFVLPKYGWRVLVFVSAVPMMICFCLILFLPESPRYLLNHGKLEKGQRIINAMLKRNKKSALEGRLTNDTIIKSKFSVKNLFYEEYRCTILLMMVIWFGVTFCYYGIVLINSEYFSLHPTCYKNTKPTLFEHRSNFSYIEEGCCKSLDESDYKSMIISSFGEFFIIPINFFLVDYIGRRKTLSLLFLLCIFFFLMLVPCLPKIWSTMMMFAVRGLTTGIFNITYIYSSEVFPTSVRSSAMGLCSSFARIAAIITPFVAQVLIPNTSLFVGIAVYASMSLICFICSLVLPIETKGRPMPQHFSNTDIEMTSKTY